VYVEMEPAPRSLPIGLGFRLEGHCDHAVSLAN